MSTKFKVLVVLCFYFQIGYSQFILEDNPKFHWPKAPVPPYGFDILVLSNPEIIMQNCIGFNSSTLSCNWQNSYRFTSFRYSLPALAFSELGIYQYDTFQSKWVVNKLNQYKYEYSYNLKRILGYNHTIENVDSFNKKQFRVAYTFDSLNRIKSELRVEIIDTNYSYVSHVDFVLNNQNQIIETHKYDITGLIEKIFYEYNNNGKLSREIILNKNKSQTVDSSIIKTYEYNSNGRVVSDQIAVYKIQSSPYVWTIVQKNDYTYFQNSMLKSTVQFTSDSLSNFQLFPSTAFNYSYTQSDKIYDYEEIIYSQGVFVSKSRFTVLYDTDDNATEADVYLWNGASYNIIPSFRYLFKQEFGTNINPVNKALQATIYPNPSNNLISIKNLNPFKIVICDMYGKELLINHNSNQIDIQSLSTGQYILIADDYLVFRFMKS